MIRSRFSALLAALAAVLVLSPAWADLPEIRLSDSNTVPACATPGRLMSFLKSRNKRLHPRFEAIANTYMRIGQTLGVRWDIAFFQMMVETANLTFTGVVRADQNNFAGLGATKGSRGESFKDIETGVRAHLEHILLYSGAHIENPVAERTRKLQEWNVLSTWYKDVQGPMTFAHLVRQWAPGSRTYLRDIDATSKAFYSGPCREPDPEAGLVAAADVSEDPGQGRPPVVPVREAAADTEPRQEAAGEPPLPGEALDERGRVPGQGTEGGQAAPPAGRFASTAVAPAEEGQTGETRPRSSGSSDHAQEKAPAQTRMASAAGAAAQAGGNAPTSSEPAKCRVWTASYGGQKALIIKAVSGKTVNYTVLDVNEGREQREAEAYIAAYAKGGQTMGEFATQAQALDKAFELCPEG